MSGKQYFSIFSLELYSYVLLFILQILSLHYVLSVLIVITLSSFMPTIETFFNCFGTRSSDAKEIITDDKTAREIQKLRNLSRPPLPPYLTGEGCLHREIRLRGTKPSRLF